CIERLQEATGNASFNNLFAQGAGRRADIDLLAHARSLGAQAQHVPGLAALADALSAARAAERTTVLLIQTDPAASTTAGGHWWDVAVPEVSERAEVRAARERYLRARRERTDDVP